MKRVLVLMGGNSTERNVSIFTGTAVLKALQNARLIKDNNVSVESYTLNDNIYDLCTYLNNNKDVIVFNALHGTGGEDGKIPALLDLFNIPYTNSGVLASAIGMNKIMSKEIARRCNMFVAKELVIDPQNVDVNGITLEYPLVLKPINEGSSTNVYLLNSVQDLINTLPKVSHLQSVMLEEYIKGVECTVGVLEGVVLGITEVQYKGLFYDYETKYTSGKSVHLLPPKNISPQVMDKIKYFATKMYNMLGATGVARVDFIVSEDMVPYFLEINTHPGLTSISLVPEQASKINISYEEMCLRLLAGAKHNS